MSQFLPSPISVLLVDPSELARAGLAIALSRDRRFTVAGEVTSFAQAPPQANQFQPDIVVVDPAVGARLDLTRFARIRVVAPQARLCIRTQHFTLDAYLDAIDAGAQAYLLKGDGDSRCVRETLALISSSQEFVTDRAILAHLRGQSTDAASPALGPRERLYLEHRAKGWTHQQIAEVAGVSLSSIKRTRAAVQRKLQSTSAVPFVLGAQAASLGLLERQ